MPHQKHDFEGFHPLRPYFHDVLEFISLNLKGVNDKYVTHYDVEVYPTSFIINKEGKVEDTFASFTNPMSKKIINKLEEIL